MVKGRKVVGEGSYGCVHKPSLHCVNNPEIQYDDYVSKIMKTKEAKNELKEFVTIGRYDPTNEFHLETPILCQPELDDKIIKKDISQCNYIKSSEVKARPNDYKILVMKFGGPDLKNLCGKELKKYLSTKTKIKTNQFWLEVLHLIKGLKFFKDNGLVHNDIKPQNILFDMETGKLTFIDFGLMRSKREIISTSNESNNFLGIYHWSYPFECGIMNKNIYDKYKKLTLPKKNKYKKELSDMILYDTKQNTFDISMANPHAFNIIFMYIDKDGDTPSDNVKYGYIQDFFNGINNLMSTESYNTNLDQIIDSIDIYGLGFTLQYILNCFYKENAIDEDFFNRLSEFFYKMYDFNLETRELDIDKLINEYETILLDTGILARLKKKPNARKKPVISKTELDLLADLDLVSKDETNSYTSDRVKIKECPPEKELNLATNRCVKKCQPGQIRNEKFRCVSSKAKAKAVSIKKTKIKAKAVSIKKTKIKAKAVSIKKTKIKANAVSIKKTRINTRAETMKKTKINAKAESMKKTKINTRAETQKYRKK
jgi:serine/threonine protein kinase